MYLKKYRFHARKVEDSEHVIYDVCERVRCSLTESRPPPVRRPAPSQIKMYGFCRLFRAIVTRVNSGRAPCTCFWQIFTYHSSNVYTSSGLLGIVHVPVNEPKYFSRGVLCPICWGRKDSQSMRRSRVVSVKRLRRSAFSFTL